MHSILLLQTSFFQKNGQRPPSGPSRVRSRDKQKKSEIEKLKNRKKNRLIGSRNKFAISILISPQLFEI